MVHTDMLFLTAHDAEERGDFAFARRSFEWLVKLGEYEALTRLAYMHDVGVGMDVDKQAAMRLYQRAWRAGRSVTAANNIAILYRERGDHRAMFAWFRRAAAIGDGSAHLDMARCYLEGSGVRKDLQSALRCLSVAISSDYISEHEREQALALMASLAPRPA